MIFDTIDTSVLLWSHFATQAIELLTLDRSISTYIQYHQYIYIHVYIYIYHTYTAFNCARRGNAAVY